MNTRNPKNAVTGVDPEVALGQIAQSAGTNPDGSARTYEVRTFGCQMNVHDSERISGLLEEAGYVAAAEEQEPDLIVFNTCAVRENADKRLYGTLGALKKTKENTLACRSPWAVVWHRKTKIPSSTTHRGSMQSSVPTTWQHFPRCSSALVTTTRHRWKSSIP